jgi:hypothetical protein
VVVGCPVLDLANSITAIAPTFGAPNDNGNVWLKFFGVLSSVLSNLVSSDSDSLADSAILEWQFGKLLVSLGDILGNFSRGEVVHQKFG